MQAPPAAAQLREPAHLSDASCNQLHVALSSTSKLRQQGEQLTDLHAVDLSDGSPQPLRQGTDNGPRPHAVREMLANAALRERRVFATARRHATHQLVNICTGAAAGQEQTNVDRSQCRMALRAASHNKPQLHNSCCTCPFQYCGSRPSTTRRCTPRASSCPTRSW